MNRHENNVGIDKKIPRRECPACGTLYFPKNYWQKYCSGVCKMFMYYKGKVDEKRNKKP